MKKRICSVCENELELTETNFHKDSSRTCGFMYTCKPCEKKRTREKYLRNPRVGRYKNMTDEQKELKLVWARKYRKTNKGKAIAYLKAYQSIDKKKNRICDFDQEYLIDSFSKPCSYCGYPSDGVDRIFNNVGHIKENCLPSCKECNIARMDNFTYEEMLIIGQTIKKVKDARLTKI
jgi:hypothetical protein